MSSLIRDFFKLLTIPHIFPNKQKYLGNTGKHKTTFVGEKLIYNRRFPSDLILKIQYNQLKICKHCQIIRTYLQLIFC